MAAWLAERVGPSGHVVAIDIDVGTWLSGMCPICCGAAAQHPGRSRRDDLDPGSYDLVCSRLMLFWLGGQAGARDPADGAMPASRRLAHRRRRPTGAQPVRWIPPISCSCRLPTGSTKLEQWFAARGYDPIFGANCQRCSSAAALRIFTTRPWPKWCAVVAVRGTVVAGHPRCHQSLGAGRREPRLGRPKRTTRRLTAACLEPTVWLMSELLHACMWPAQQLTENNADQQSVGSQRTPRLCAGAIVILDRYPGRVSRLAIPIGIAGAGGRVQP